MEKVLQIFKLQLQQSRYGVEINLLSSYTRTLFSRGHFLQSSLYPRFKVECLHSTQAERQLLLYVDPNLSHLILHNQ